MISSDRIIRQTRKGRPGGTASSTIWTLLLVAMSGLVVVISSYMVLARPHVSSGWTSVVALVCIIWLVVYVFCSYRQLGTVYLFTSAYILPLSIFHLGVIVPDAIGWLDASVWTEGGIAPWIYKASWYTALSLGCIGIGFGLSINRQRISRMWAPASVAEIDKALSLMYWAGIGLLLASIANLAIAVYSVGNLLQYTRNDFFKGVGDTRGLGVFLYLFPGSVILLMISARTRLQSKLSWALFAFAFILIMLSGYRTTALFPLMVGAVIWVKTGRKIPTVYSVVAILVVLIIIPITGKLRSAGDYKDINVDLIKKSAEGVEIKDSFREMGSTAGVLAETLRLVPDEDPYRYGSSYLLALKNSIPNITLTQDTSAVEMVRKRAALDPELLYKMAPQDWLTYRIDPLRFKAGGGVGFSSIGEAYLNFGYAGVLVFFTMLGYSLGRLDQVNLLRSSKMLLFVCCGLWPLMRTVRDSAGTFIKPLVFVYLTLLIWWIVTRFLIKKKV